MLRRPQCRSARSRIRGEFSRSRRRLAAGGAAIATDRPGGNLGQISQKASAIAGVTAAQLTLIAWALWAPAQSLGANFNPLVYAENVAGSALVGCASSAASGGSCGSGGGRCGERGVRPVTNTVFPERWVQSWSARRRHDRSGHRRRSASVAGGGKFANGAVTGAFGYLVAPGPVSGRGDPMNANDQVAMELCVTGPVGCVAGVGITLGQILFGASGCRCGGNWCICYKSERYGRRRPSILSARPLRQQTNDAESSYGCLNAPALGIFGLSTSLVPNPNYTGQVVRSAAEQDILGAGFTITQTGGDLNHYTIGIPNPVKAAVARTWNGIFK